MPEKQIVLLSDATGPQRVFREIVVDLQAAILQISVQGVPLRQRIAHRFAQRTLGQQRRPELIQPDFYSAQDWRGQLMTQRVTLFSGHRFLACMSFDEIELS